MVTSLSAWISNPVLSMDNYMTMAKLIKLSIPQFLFAYIKQVVERNTYYITKKHF